MSPGTRFSAGISISSPSRITIALSSINSWIARIVCSDFHLNKNNRLDDFKYAILQIAKYAVENKVHEVLFLGDAFHRQRPSPIEMRVFEEWVRLLTDKEFRNRVLKSVTHQQVKEFWAFEFEKYSAWLRSEAISPILNKVGLFKSSSLGYI